MQGWSRLYLLVAIAAAVVGLAWWASLPNDEVPAHSDEARPTFSEPSAGRPSSVALAAGPVAAEPSGAGSEAPVAPPNPGASPIPAPAHTPSGAPPSVPPQSPSATAAAPPAPSEQDTGGSDTDRRDREAIVGALQSLLPALTDCVKQGTRLNPDFGGDFTLDFRLAPTDAGVRAREGEVADSTLRSPLVEACILSAVRAAKFEGVNAGKDLQIRVPLAAHAGELGFGGSE